MPTHRCDPDNFKYLYVASVKACDSMIMSSPERLVQCTATEDRRSGGEQDKGTGFTVHNAEGSFVFPSHSFFFCLKQVPFVNPSIPPLSLKSISLGFLEF